MAKHISTVSMPRPTAQAASTPLHDPVLEGLIATCISAANFPPRVLRMAEKHSLLDGAADAARACDDGKLLIVLHGAVGTGKSVASVQIAHDRLKACTASAFDRHGGASGWSCYFASAYELGRAEFHREDLQRIAKKVSLLIVDDLGTETDHDARGLATLICNRFHDGKQTIATTNLHGEQFSKRYGPRLLDRATESGRYVSMTQRVRTAAA